MVSLIIVIILYFGLLYTAYNTQKSAFVGILIILCCFYDFLFIDISYTLPAEITTILKPFQEFIILIGCVLILLNRNNKETIRISYKKLLMSLCVLIPLIVSIFSSIINGMEVNILITGFRCFFVPILCTYIVTYKEGINIKPWIFEIISLLMVIYAIFQVYCFSGNLNELWVYESQYDSYGENLIDKAYYNYLKNGSLRAISFFVTPIDLSITSAACSLFFICTYINLKKFNYLFFSIFSILGIFLSQTRIGFFTLLIGIGIIIYLKLNKVAKKKCLIGGPLILIVITLLYVVLIGDIDLSALGRLTQYIEFNQNFSILGRGLGDQSGVFSYDSFILCCLNLFGISGILYLSFYILLFSKVIKIYNQKKRDSLITFTIVLSSSMLYVFGFHHIAGSFIYWLVILLLFNAIAFNNDKRINNTVKKNISYQ